MEKLFNELIEKAKKNRKGMKRLKDAIVTCQHYELATKIREIEREVFPETDEVIKAKEDAKKLNLIFRMVDLDITHDTCYLIEQTLKMHREKGGDFSIEDAVALRLKNEEIFLK